MVKMNEKYIFKIKREKNDHKNINMKDKVWGYNRTKIKNVDVRNLM